jgi:dihydroflavonol-4-reductase
MEKPSGNGAGTAARHQPRVALVTGASGFIGSHVVRLLVDEGVKVRALVQQGAPLGNLDGLPIERVAGDLLDGHSLERAVEGCDTVFHLAAIFAYWLPDPSLMYRVNVEGTVRLLRAALRKGVQRVVHTSSIAAVGIVGGPESEGADEETPFNSWDTADDYVLSKYVSELEALAMVRRGLDVVVVNPAFPFGGNDIAPTPTGVLIQRYISGENPFVFRGGLNIVPVEDVARGHLLAARRGRPGERYILGGHNLTYREFANEVCDTAGVRRPRWEVPTAPFARVGRLLEWVSDHVTRRPPLMVDRALRYSTERHLYFRIDKARRELGYEPGPWKPAIAEAVRWFKEGRERRLAGDVAATPSPERAAPAPAAEARP